MTDLIETYGISVVVAAGNLKTDSCSIVPANVASAISVAAMDTTTKFGASTGNADVMYSWSNTGGCISVFAPGVDILSACGGAGNPHPAAVLATKT